jgi:hypothetical protein
VLHSRFLVDPTSKPAGMLAYVDQLYMPPATTAVAEGSRLNFEIFKIVAEKSRTSMETFSAKETLDRTRGVMEIAAKMEIVANMTVTKMEIATKMEIVANMEIAASMVTVETTTDRVVRIPRAARTSAPTEILSRPVARQEMANGDSRRSGTTTSATETLPIITGSSNVSGELVSRDGFKTATISTRPPAPEMPGGLVLFLQYRATNNDFTIHGHE